MDPDVVLSPPPRVGAEAWVRGFHGVVVDLDGRSAASLRQVALSRRSAGTLRMGDLTLLPERVAARVEPSAGRGDRHVAADAADLAELGTDAAALPRPAPAAPATPPEPLTAVFDRRLGEAKFLLLPHRGVGYAVAKRTLDLVVAVVLLALAAPVMLALAVLIRLDSPGPAVFRQERVTRGGRTFRFYKFRTMYTDARTRFPELYEYASEQKAIDGTFYKLADDPRNTRVGRWLRRTTLDELPNLFNVVKGDLSLVGPRPDLPELVRLYRPEELCCLFTKAGLTGVAQVAGRSLLTVRERLTLDMRYVAQQSFLLDLRILWRTVVVVLSGRGAF